MLYCSVNYQPVDSLSIQDRGLAYGDGLFTTAKIAHGHVEMFKAHLERLQTGCIALGINLPNFEQLAEQVNKAVQNYPLAVLKIMITAGAGGRGYSRLGVQQCNVIMMIFDFPQHYLSWQQEGINLGIAQCQLGLTNILSGIKHLNRLEQVMIRKELDQCDSDDLLVLDLNQQVVETSCANIFWCEKGVWFTPEITQAGISGLMRNKILKMVENITVIKTGLPEFTQLDAAFICNSVMGLVPVNCFNEQTIAMNMSKEFINKIIAEDKNSHL